VLLLAAIPTAASGSTPWQQIIDEDGIKVWQREVPGSSIVEFRARGRIQAPLIQVAAVLRNSGREEEWMESCVDSHVVEYHSAIEAVIYNRTGSPVPFISDRDLVVEAKTTVLPNRHALRVDFQSVQHARAPSVDGVVRMAKVEGHWELARIDANTTEVDYQIQADPGGALPSWLVNWASQRIPFNTIAAMRNQVKKAGYENDILILERAIDWAELEGGKRTAQAEITERTPG
jgi:hypothetical protein